MKEKKSVGTQLGEAFRELCYFITILFCALRSCDVITWPWYWVMSPIFFSWIICLVLMVFIGAIAIEIAKDKGK